MAKINVKEVNDYAFNLVRGITEHLKQLRQNSNLAAEWKQAEKSYHNGSDDFYAGVSKVRVPALHQAVERIVPKMDKVLFPPDGEFLGVLAKDQSDDIAVDDAEAVQELIKQQFKDVNVRSKLISIYRSLCIYGTVFVRTFWDQKKIKRYTRDENGNRVEKFETIYDNPDFYSPNIWDVYIDPKDENLEGWYIEKIAVEFNTLWNLRKRTDEDGNEVGLYDVETLKRIREMSVKKDSDDGDKNQSEETRGLSGHTYGPGDHKLFLWQAYGPVPKWLLTKNDKDKEEKTVVQDALIEIVTTESGMGEHLRTEDNPNDHGEKPVLRGRYIALNNKAYGLGVMSVNIPLEAELNTLRNQLVDLRSFILKKKWIVDRGANITESELQDIHNKVIYTDLMNGIRDIVPADFSGSASIQMQQIMQDIEDSTGASKLLGGTPSGSSLDRTAAGIATVVQGGLERFELVVTQFQEDILKPLVRHFWLLDQQFLPDGRDVTITGKGIIRVLPTQINLFDQDLNFLGIRELGEKEFKINALNILLQNLSPFIPLGLDPIPVVMRFFKLTGMGDLAKEVDKRPETQLEETPEGEVQLLAMGRNVKINLNDDHDAYLKTYEQAFFQQQIPVDPLADPQSYSLTFDQLLRASKMPDNVKANLKEAVGQRLVAMGIQRTGIKPANE